MKKSSLFPFLLLVFSLSASAEDPTAPVFKIVPVDHQQKERPIKITIRNANSAESKAIIEAVTAALGTRTNATGTNTPMTLDDEIAAQSDVVQDLRKELTVLIQQYGIPVNGGGQQPMGLTQAEFIKTARERLPQFRTQRDEIQIQLKKLSELTNDDLIKYAAGLDLPENHVTYYFRQHRKIENHQRKLTATGLGPDHPKIRTLNQQAREFMKEAHKEATSLKGNLKVKLELIDRQIERMTEMINEAKKSDTNLAPVKNEYHQTKEAYEQAREKLQEMKLLKERQKR